jgi:hypothetical protein
MATIAEVRAKFPQYADMPDAALADALHKKFYADIPRAEFDAKIGLTPAAPAAPSAPAAAAPAQPTMVEKAYKAVRPFAAPLVEAGGAIVGGLVGTPMGPLGTVGGAGLGYGIAKEALELGDIYLGGKAPRQGAAQVVEPVRNVIEGSTMEMGGQALGKAVGYVGGKVADFRQVPTQKAAAIAQKALGDDLPTVLNALRNAPANASVADVTAKIENPGWQALIKNALEKDPQFVRKARLMSENESLNALAKLAGGTTATETRAAGEAAKNMLNTVTGPMRETAIKRANLGQFVADDAALRQANDLAVLTGSGSKIDPKQFVAQAAGAEKALRSVGIKPLESESIIRSIAATADNPAFAGNDLISGAVKNVADDIAKWTNQGGVIDANALEAIRKNSVNAAIAQLRPGSDATAQRNLAAGVMSKIKPLIDDAIEGAGGAGWRDYLTKHSEGMRKIAEKKLSGEALRLWKSDKDAFVRLVQNESPDVVEKFLGPGNYNIATELADSTMAVLQKQAEKRLTELSVKEQVTEGGAALAQLLKQETSRFRFPSFLNFWASAGNKTLSELEQRLGNKTMEQLTKAMKTPEGAADLLKTLPAAERNQVLQILSDPSTLSKGSSMYPSSGKFTLGQDAVKAGKAAQAIRTGASVNMLGSSNENQNALAK